MYYNRTPNELKDYLLEPLPISGDVALSTKGSIEIQLTLKKILAQKAIRSAFTSTKSCQECHDSVWILPFGSPGGSFQSPLYTFGDQRVCNFIGQGIVAANKEKMSAPSSKNWGRKWFKLHHEWKFLQSFPNIFAIRPLHPGRKWQKTSILNHLDINIKWRRMQRFSQRPLMNKMKKMKYICRSLHRLNESGERSS